MVLWLGCRINSRRVLRGVALGSQSHLKHFHSIISKGACSAVIRPGFVCNPLLADISIRHNQKRLHILTIERKQQLYDQSSLSTMLQAANFGHWRTMATDNGPTRRAQTSVIYICAVGVFMVGMAYAGVPLYRMFCQVCIVWKLFEQTILTTTVIH